MTASGLQWIVADLADRSWFSQIAGPVHYVLNTVSSGGAGTLEGYQHSYVEGMRSIVAWMNRGAGAQAIIYTSSTSVYPQGNGAVVTEAAPCDPATDRARVLLQAERILLEGDAGDAAVAASSSRTRPRGYERAVVLRLAGIYGPGRHHLLDQVRSGVVAGSGSHRLNLAHRDDICSAIWTAFDAPPVLGDDVFNVADDEPAPKAEVCAWLAKRLNVPVPTFTDLPAGNRRAVTPDRVISNGKLRRTFDWSPRFPSFREGYENILSRTAQ